MADGSNLQLALRITADLRSAVSQLLALQKQIDGVSDSAKAAAASTEVQAKATDKLGDSSAADGASERKLIIVRRELNDSSRELAASTHELAAADIEQAEASEAARVAANAHVTALREAKAAEAARIADAAAAVQLFNNIDPVGGKLNQIDAYEAELNRLHKADAISHDDFLTFGALLQANRSKLLGVGEDAEKAGKGVEKFGLNTAFARLELARIGKDAATGQFGSLERSALTLATRMGILGPLFTATGAAIAATALAVVAYAGAVASGEAQQHELETALIATGNQLGLTAGQLGAIRDSVAQTTHSYGDAQKAVIALGTSGKLSAEGLQAAAQAAVNISALTGESIEKTTTEIQELATGGAEALVKLNDRYGFLTKSVFDQVEALRKQGDETGAVKLEIEALSETTTTRVAEMDATAGTLERAWNAVKGAIHDAGQELHNFGRTDLEYQAQQESDQLGKLQETTGIAGFVNSTNPLLEQQKAAHLKRLEELHAQIAASQAQEQAAGTQAELTKKYTDATHAIDEQTLALDRNAQKQHALTKLHQQYADIAALDPNDKRLHDGSLEILEADIEKRFAEHIPKDRSGLGIDRAQLASDVAAFQQAWSDAEKAFSNAERELEADRKADAIDDQAYFQAKQDDINKLRDAQVSALEQEKAQVAGHGKTAADRIRIDQQVADIDAKIAQAQQDAAAKSAALDDAKAENDKRRAEEYSQLQQQYYEAIGDPAGAQLLRVRAEFDKDMKAMLEAGNVDGQILAQKLFNVGAAQAQLQRIQQQVDLTLGRLDLINQQASADQQAGLLSDLQAKQRVIDANLAQAAQLHQLAQQALITALASGNPQAILQAQQLVEKVRELGLVTSALGQEVQTTLSDSFSQFLQNWVTGAETLRQAFGDLLKSIAQGLARIAADDLSQRLFAQLHSLFQPGSTGAAAGGSAQLASAAASTTAAGSTVELGATTLQSAAATLGVSADSLLQAAYALEQANATGGQSGGSGGGLGFLGSLFGSGASAAADSSLFDSTGAFAASEFSTGGGVYGPGTETSDSIFARLSTGEFVHNAAAVRHYGPDFMHAVNARRFPKFAEGGFVGLSMPSSRQLSGGRGAGQGPHTLKVVPVFDPSMLAGAMAGPDGEKVYLMHFKNNIPQLRAMLGR